MRRWALFATPAAPVRPSPDQARDWLHHELAKPDYQQGLVARVLGWLGDQWDALQSGASSASGLSVVASVLLAVVLVVLVALVVSRARREPGAARDTSPDLSGQGLSADQHRAKAETALREHDADLAVVEAFRAIAVRSVRRGLVEERPGMTVHELTAELAPLFPSQQAALVRGSTVFDLAFYGHVPAREDEARAILDLDHALAATRPTRATTGAVSP